ncbi:TPA: hypothetical protein ACNVCI_001643 [Citrobacter braakii]|uniref:hypothetical protein n=1 Tax=Citrobacter TaxID=544 RepID=UPI0020174708|nr:MULTISPECIES: hypothetical protein [Citrobacter]MDW2593089.1 hypothetical protein [Citrobacter braakii]MDW2656845.1 hypothetical protein [Citrobacter braakii]MDW2704617.1 hypothetical protein [Citrobacter braakii]
MKPDVKKIIADIKATKGNRKFCNGLAGTLQDDNYASSICKYVKTVTPERIDLLIEYAEKLEAEVTDMAVQLANAESKCRELAGENEKQNTHSEALAVDNAALREVVERMVNQFAMSGISPEEKSINPAKSLMFDAKSALFMPATDAYLAEVRAAAVDEVCLKISNEIVNCYQDEQVGLDAAATICGDFAAQLRKGAAL